MHRLMPSEAIGSVRTLQAFTSEKPVTGRFAQAVDRAFEAARQATLSRAVLTAIAIFLVFASVVIVLWVGAQDVLAGQISAGRLSQFILYAVFAAGGARRTEPGLGRDFAGLGRRRAPVRDFKVEPQVKAPAQAGCFAGAARAAKSRSRMSASSIRRGRKRRRSTMCRCMCGRARRSRSSAPPARAKSTIFHLILRFYDPTSGRISFDGVRIADADPMELRHRIALVPQETAIFATSIRENIGFGRPDASSAQIERAAEMAAADRIHPPPAAGL